jgi:predicted DNA-binding transcriptional regulator YafY
MQWGGSDDLSNMHRIQWFDLQIREGNYPNSGQLADHFEISRRQAQRDIEYLTISLRAPLVYIAKHRGYTYEDKTYVLPQLIMTDDEKRLLKYLAFRYRHYSYEDAGTISRVSNLLERIGEEGEACSFRRMPVFEANAKLMQVVEQLTCAVEQRLIVELTYQEQEEQVRRAVHPIQLVSRYATDYLAAYCKQSQQQRMFRLDGIRQVNLTDMKFEAAAIGQHEWIDCGSIVRKPYIAKLVLIESQGGPFWNGYRVRSRADDVYEIEFYDADSFVQQLIVSDWQQVLSPKWLRAKLLSSCRNVLAKLDAGSDAGGRE